MKSKTPLQHQRQHQQHQHHQQLLLRHHREHRQLLQLFSSSKRCGMMWPNQKAAIWYVFESKEKRIIEILLIELKSCGHWLDISIGIIVAIVLSILQSLFPGNYMTFLTYKYTGRNNLISEKIRLQLLIKSKKSSKHFSFRLIFRMSSWRRFDPTSFIDPLLTSLGTTKRSLK